MDCDCVYNIDRDTIRVNVLGWWTTPFSALTIENIKLKIQINEKEGLNWNHSWMFSKQMNKTAARSAHITIDKSTKVLVGAVLRVL